MAKPGRKGKAERQRKYLQARARGLSNVEAIAEAGVSNGTLWAWHKKDPEFHADAMRLSTSKWRREAFDSEQRSLDFVSFRNIVLGRHTFPHMRQWSDWFQADNDHILILCPPETAKTTFVLDFCLWLIYKDPNVRIGYASRAQPHAVKQVSKVKNIIEQNQELRKLVGELVPGPGDPHPWRDQYFTVRQRQWIPGEDEADYTMAAFGAASQITGSRFNLLVFDDPDDVNVPPSVREDIWNVILQAGETRIGTTGRMVIIGNRQDEEDVYRRILDQWNDDPDLWSIYMQKAIITEKPQPELIWPEKFGAPRDHHGTITPETPWTIDRAYDFFDRKRRRLRSRFNLVYQNDPVGEMERDFPQDLINRAKDTRHQIGKYPPGSTIICSMDPAPSGGAAILVYALMPPDNTSPNAKRRRKIVDFEWGENWRHEGCLDRIKRYGGRYHPRYWVIERSATSSYFLQDPNVREIIQRQGAYLHEPTTGWNKTYGDFQVSSLRELFVGETPLLIIPAASLNDWDWTAQLRSQLTDYVPKTLRPQDGPMSLWLAERCIRELHLDRSSFPQDRVNAWPSPYGNTWQGGSFGGPAMPGGTLNPETLPYVMPL